MQSARWHAHPNFHYYVAREKYPGRYERAADIAIGRWHHLRLEIIGARMRTLVDSVEALVVEGGVHQGQECDSPGTGLRGAQAQLRRGRDDVLHAGQAVRCNDPSAWRCPKAHRALAVFFGRDAPGCKRDRAPATLTVCNRVTTLRQNGSCAARRPMAGRCVGSGKRQSEPASRWQAASDAGGDGFSKKRRQIQRRG